MWIQNPVPVDGQFTYVFKVKGRDWFKIGISGDPGSRLRSIQGRDLRLDTYRCWRFENYFAALHVEQTIVAYLKMFEFNAVGEANEWFEINECNMQVVAEIVGELAQQIRTWENANFGLMCHLKEWDPGRKMFIPGGATS